MERCVGRRRLGLGQGRARLGNGTEENPGAGEHPGHWEQLWHEGQGLRDGKVGAVWESSRTGARHGPDRWREGTWGWRDMVLPEEIGWVSSETGESQGKSALEHQCETKKRIWNEFSWRSWGIKAVSPA